MGGCSIQGLPARRCPLGGAPPLLQLARLLVVELHATRTVRCRIRFEVLQGGRAVPRGPPLHLVVVA